MKKIISMITTICFIFTGVFGSAFASLGINISTINDITFESTLIPASLGKITSAKYYDSDEIIINIQDLHCHAQTQRQISSIIGYIDNIYKLDKVYLEGAFNNVDTGWLSAFNNSANGTKILEGLVNSGKLSGTEYYSIINNKNNFVVGIEDEKLYKENIRLLGEIIKLQPEIEAICMQLTEQISKIKKDYSSRKSRNLDILVNKFNSKKIDTKEFYTELNKYITNLQITITKYPNINMYINLMNSGYGVNNNKIIKEFSNFISEVKNVITYQQYLDLLKRSNNFKNIDNISVDLNNINTKYEITKKLKLYSFEKILTYFNFNRNINPIELVKEEDALIEEMFDKLGRTKYEKEVSFLSKFIPTIKQYFTAEISADEYTIFDEEFNKFKKVWANYLVGNKISELNKYKELVSKYHKNNIIRNEIFAKHIIKEKENKSKEIVNDKEIAIEQIKNNINKKQIKLVVTGGFHTRGLEKIFEKERISYLIITPKITQPIEQAKQIYLNNVMYYSNLLKNTINIEPLTQEPLNISFPKILNNILILVQDKSFEVYEKNQIKEAVREFVEENIISKQSSLYGQVEILNWIILNQDITKGKVEIEVEYKDKSNKSTISKIKYLYDNKELISYSDIDVLRTNTMLDKVTKNKYALPSIELEPTDKARKQISKHILEPLREVVGTSISLMPYTQLHMTVGYDNSEIMQEEIESLVNKVDKTTDIFTVTDKLGKNFINFKTSLSGTLKLMPDGVIIYEITDKNLIKEMMNLRTKLKNSDEKYKTPSIVHMTIGRISDKNLLKDTLQSKQELATLLEKLNEKIYDINKENALSKVKSTFNLKSGYVSSTGDKDYVVKQVFPKMESLVIFKNIFNKTSKSIDRFYKIVLAPIVEEVFFRYVPFIIVGTVITNPSFVIPSIITCIVGILGFSVVHPLADKINNYFYDKVQQGKINNSFVSKIFNNKLEIRDWKNFIIQSTILTGVYIAISVSIPQIAILAPIVTIILHSINNILAIIFKSYSKLGKVFKLLAINQEKQNDNDILDKFVDSIGEDLSRTIDTGDYKYSYGKQKEFKEQIENLILDFKNIKNMPYELKKEQLKEKLLVLLESVFSCRNERFYFSVNEIYKPILLLSSYLDDNLFDKVFDIVLFEINDKNNSSSRYFDIMMSSAKYLLSVEKIEKVHKILDSLYQNKKKVKDVTDYGKLALPLPSPFDKKYSTIEDWEKDIYKIISNDNDIYPNWYDSLIKLFLSEPGEKSKYAYQIIKALYETKKIKTPIHFIDFTIRKSGYDWTKEFYNACGAYGQYFNLEKSVLLFNKNENLFKEDVTLSEVISKLGYLKITQEKNKYIQSSDFDSVIDTLRNSLNLSKKEQIKVLKQQMNIIYKELFDNEEDIKYLEILSILASTFGLFNKENKSITLLEDICNKFVVGEISKSKESSIFRNRITFKEDLNKKYEIVSYIYIINKEKAIKIIQNLFDDSVKTELYGTNWKYWSPATIEEARNKVPQYLKKAIFDYADLELFYNSIGISFDLIGEQSQLYDRQEYVSEYHKLLSFIPNNIVTVKHNRKYFRTLKHTKLQQSNITKEQELALDRILKNSDIALQYINNGDIDSLNKAIVIIEAMIEDLQIISLEKVDEFEKKLNDIKNKIKNGEIEDILKEQITLWSKDTNKIYPIIYDINIEAISKIKNISDKFEAFEKVLENNELALSSLSKMNEDSLSDTIYFIEEMLNNFEIISPRYAQKAKISLLKIKNNIDNGSVKIEDLAKLKSWNENKLDEINELHTLINAVHQTSTTELMNLAMLTDDKNNGKKFILREDGKDMIPFYDCSKNFIKKEMVEFLISLSKIELKSKNGWIIKDNKLLYSNQLGCHGVNILVDMDEGIRVTFNDSGRGDGNAMRTTLLATLFAQAGFDITYIDTTVSDLDSVYGICNFSAIYNVKDSLLAPEKYASLFYQALKILLSTKNLDYNMEGIDEEYPHSYGHFKIPSFTLEDFRKMKNTYDKPKEFLEGSSFSEEWEDRIKKIKEIKNILQEQQQAEEQEVSKIHEYLNFSSESKSSLTMVCDYVKEKFIVNNNNLEINSNYDVIGDILSAVNTNIDETLRQAQVINLLDLNTLQFEAEGYIGAMVAESGVLKLDNDNWLSIKIAVDRERKRAKFAFVEQVDFNGNRTKLDYKELIKILKKYEYPVKEQKERNKSEKEASLQMLKEKIYPSKDGIYMRGMGVSGQNDGYVPVRITYDKVNVDNNSMWVVSYTSPEDVETIIKAKGLMTTGGGMLSHANITARENGKVAILSNGRWKNGQLEIPYYLVESNVENKMGYEVQKISEHNIILNEGDIILANGITGRILLYDKIPKEDIPNIQKAIDTNDIDLMFDCIRKYDDVEIIRQVVEYIFLQTICDESKNKLTEILLAWEADEVESIELKTDIDIGKEIFDKVRELNDVYIIDKMQDIKETILNEESIEDENIRYSIILKLEQELSTIKYSVEPFSGIEELAELKQKVNQHKKEVVKKMYLNIKYITKYAQEILSKETISQEEKDKLIKISEKAKVWNYYGSKELKQLIAKTDKFIFEKEIEQSNKNIDYDTEIMNLSSIKLSNIFRFGSKTTELANIMNFFISKHIKNIKVPDGIGISKDVLRIFCEKAGKGKEYNDLIENFNKAITSNDKDLALSIGKQISDLIESIDSKELEKLLLSKLNGETKYAVRSSGVGEDGKNHAFAGMAKTELNVNSSNVYKFVKEGWKSFFTETCIEDMIKEEVFVQPALLIQEMVPNVAKAGVMFTRDAKGNLTQEAVLGLGDGLVSGRINPDHIIVRVHDGKIDYRRALDNMVKVEEKAEGGTKVTKLTREEKIERILDESMINQLKYIAFMLEKDAGYPVDIEFAIDSNGNIFVLQRRAITTLQVPTEIDYSEYEQEISKIVSENTKCQIALVSGDVALFDEEENFVNISNPLDNTESIPVYIYAIDNKFVEFIVDSKYSSIVNSGVLGELLLERINNDPAVLKKFNMGLFAYKPGDIELLPVLDDRLKQTEFIEESIDNSINNIRKMLASA